MSRTPTLAEVILDAIESRLLDVHTCIPAEVVSYDGDTQTARVRPLLDSPVLDADGVKTVEQMPTIPNVPVKFPGTGTFSITWPLSAGDTGELAFNELNIGQWQETGERGDPGDFERHGLSGATFWPGLRHKGNASDDADATALVIGAPQIKLGSKNASESMVLGDLLKTWLLAHTHSGVTVGGGVTGMAVDLPPPADIAAALSTKIKVE